MIKSYRRHVSWSNLPGEIIHKISNHLKTREEILKFKHICRKWRKYSLPIPVNILSLNLPFPIPISSNSVTLPFHTSTSPLILQVSSIYLITPSQLLPVSSVSSKSWMIMGQESNPGKIRLHHPLTAKRVKNILPSLNLTQFRVSELAHGYNFKYSDCVHKVLLCSSTSASSLEIMVLYREGSLGKLTVKITESQENDEDEDEEEKYCWKGLRVRQRRIFWFQYLDDVVHFKEMVCAVDRKGKLYVLDVETMIVASVLVSDPICRGDIPTQRRKRLVVDSVSGELHLVVREREWVKARFTVYKFNEHCKKWDVLERLGNERLLFVGVDHCFFARAKDFPECKGNCIVFAANCFTQYRGLDTPDGRLFGDENVEVGVYRLGKGDNFRLLSSAYPEFSKSIWPPPTWFSPKRECNDDEETDSGSSSEQACNEGNSSNIICLSSDHEDEGVLTDSSSESSSPENKDEEMLLESSSQKSSKVSDNNGTDDSEEDDEEEAETCSRNDQTCDFEANFSDKVRTASSEPVTPPAMKNNAGPPLTIEYKQHDMGTSKVNSQKDAGGFDFSAEKVCNASSTPVTPSAIVPACKTCSSTLNFEGVEIKSELLPTLQTIWARHGSLICKDTVCSKDMRACALESVAKVMITLQNTTGKTLTDSQAADIKSILSDLQRVGLKVDWLVPTVEKALKLLKSKPMIESITLLDKKRAQVDKEEKEFLARTKKVKQELEDSMACLSARIPFPELIDLDDCLGDGLL
ncbi:hypothetical protein BVRB_5g118750 [Beta vulgaris subsp. vulgaris]|nr:hypothetical protein BVRB_5g118750 [Beta vulgaris subsp. vulgaris]